MAPKLNKGVVIERALEATAEARKDAAPPMPKDQINEMEGRRGARTQLVSDLALANLKLAQDAAKTLKASMKENRGIDGANPDKALALLNGSIDKAKAMKPQERDAAVIKDIKAAAEERIRLLESGKKLTDPQKDQLATDGDAIAQLAKANPELMKKAAAALKEDAAKETDVDKKTVAAHAADNIDKELQSLGVTLNAKMGDQKHVVEAALQKPATVPKVEQHQEAGRRIG
jgi:hypothetical protein